MTDIKKEVVIFDLDGTLTESKAPLEAGMSDMLCRLLGVAKVAVISGAAFRQFEKQFLAFLKCPAEKLAGLFLVPTNGSAMYCFKAGKWEKIYAEELSVAERKKIIDSIHESFEDTGFVPEKKIYGDLIEDRGTQVTFSGLGQLAPVELKKKWDPDRSKRMKIKACLDIRIPEFEIRVNSSSSIDITRKGIDKAYGVRQIEKHLGIGVEKMVFVGDALFPGGNDYAARRTGVECVEVSGPEETKKFIRDFLARL